MKTLLRNGNNILVEVTNISRFGIWLFVAEKEFFLPYKNFPWFEDATARQIFNVQQISKNHMYWPDLDVDISVDMIKNPDKYPLIAK